MCPDTCPVHLFIVVQPRGALPDEVTVLAICYTWSVHALHVTHCIWLVACHFSDFIKSKASLSLYSAVHSMCKA